MIVTEEVRIMTSQGMIRKIMDCKAVVKGNGVGMQKEMEL